MGHCLLKYVERIESGIFSINEEFFESKSEKILLEGKS